MTVGVSADTRGLIQLKNAALDQRPVGSGVHDFYRYPARFAPSFAQAVIETFSEPDDLVLDPFMGGGTTLVEAQRLGRLSYGFDINPLATFVTQAKVTLYSKQAVDAINAWRLTLPDLMNAHLPAPVDDFWVEAGYLRNFTSTEGWWLRKLIAQALVSLPGLPPKAALLARCALLRTGQWALDLRDELPSAAEFRNHLDQNVLAMIDAALAYRREIFTVASDKAARDMLRPRILCQSAASGIGQHRATHAAPDLVLTSPPYPGVYVLYHRWKINSRKESPLPYWIANSLDGRGISHYILGPRKEPNLVQYFTNLRDSFSVLVATSKPDTWFVQMVGFSDEEAQLPRYLETLENAGLTEYIFDELATRSDGRLWRQVPGRRWFAKNQDAASNTGHEVVLFHRIKA